MSVFVADEDAPKQVHLSMMMKEKEMCRYHLEND
jgi:hypothetical protein